MAKNLKLSLVLTANGKLLSSEVRKAGQSVSKFSQQTDKAARSANKTSSALAKIGHYGATYLGVRFLLTMASDAMQAADNQKLLASRIELATDRTGNFSAVYGKLTAMSLQNHVALSTTVDLFQNLARVAPELGRNTNEVLQLTDSIQKLGQVSGADQTALKNALRQFSQSMASGIVRAEEFNSIIENTPALANAIADGMGTTVGQLRLAVVEGKVLSDDVFAAVLSQTDTINKQFAKLPLTIARSKQDFATAASIALDAIDANIGVTTLYANAIQAASEHVLDLAFAWGNVETAAKSASNNQNAAQLAELTKLRNEYNATLNGTYAGNVRMLGVAKQRALANIDTVNAEIAIIEKEIAARKAQEEIAKQIGAVDANIAKRKRSILTLDNDQLASRRAAIQVERDNAAAVAQTAANTNLAAAQLKGFDDLLVAIATRQQAITAKNTVDQAKQVKQTESALQLIIAALQTEEQQIAASYAKRQIIIANARNNGLASEANLSALKEQLQREEAAEIASFQRRQTQAAANEITKRVAAEQAEQQRIEQQQLFKADERLRLAQEYATDEEMAIQRRALEQEQQQIRYEESLANLQTQRDDGVISQQQFADYTQQLQVKNKAIQLKNEHKYLAAVTQAEQLSGKRQVSMFTDFAVRKILVRQAQDKFQRSAAAQELALYNNTCGSIFASAAKHNKVFFKINQAAKIANAVANTYAGATQALAAYPPPFSFAMAAAVIAAGFINVKAIKSQSFAGGGSSAAAPSTSAAAPSAGASMPSFSAALPSAPPPPFAPAVPFAAAPAVPQQVIAETQRDIFIHIEGAEHNRLLAQSLIQALKDEELLQGEVTVAA